MTAASDPDAGTELAEVAGELYEVDPGEFVAARNALARRLRGEGRRDLAARVGKLRRPSPAAWAVNQLVRRHADDVDELVRSGERLRAVQDRTLAGADASELRSAGRARREAIARLSDLAAGLLAERGAGAGAHQSEIVATLEAASVDPEAAAEVERGRLTAALEPPSGFGGLGVDAGVGLGSLGAGAVDSTAPESGSAPSEAEHGKTGGLTAARRAATEAAERARTTAARAHELTVRVEARRREVEATEADVARAQRALDDARRRAEVAEADATEARAVAEAAEKAATEAAERLSRAERDSAG